MVGSRPLLTFSALVTLLISVHAHNTSFQQARAEDQPDGVDEAVSGAWANTSQASDGGAVEDDDGGGGIFGATTVGSLWARIRPYIVGRDAAELAERLATFRRTLLTKAEDMVALFSRAAEDRLSDRPRPSPGWAADDEGAEEGDDVGRRRTRREHPMEFPLTRDPDGMPLLEDVRGVVDLGLRGSQSVKMISWHGRLFVAAIDNTMNVSIFTLDQHLRQTSHALRFPARHSCGMTVVPGDELLVACIAPFSSRYATFYEKVQGEVTVFQVMEEAPGRGDLTLQFRQKIQTEDSRDLTMWTHADRNFLLIADTREVTESFVYKAGGILLANKTNYHTTSRLYHWTGEYFDVLQELPGTYPRSVKHFVIQNLHFIAMANFRNNKGPCNPDTHSRIYRYHSGKFILFQEIPTSYAVQWLAIQVKDNVLLAVANTVAGVRFYQYNGWRFVPTTIQHYAGPFGAGVKYMAAVDWNEEKVMAISNENPEKSSLGASTLYKIVFRNEKSLQEFHERSEAWCQAQQVELVRTEEVVSLRQRVEAAPTVTQPYTFTQPVTIHGNLAILKPSEATKVYETSRDRWVPDVAGSVAQVFSDLHVEIARAKARLEQCLKIVGPATWPGGLHFGHLVASQVSATSSVRYLTTLVVNGVSTALDEIIPLTSSRVVHIGFIRFSHLLMQGVAARVSRLQGLEFSTYVSLTGHHAFRDHVTFLTPVAAASVISFGVVDGIIVGRDSILLTSTHQNHTGRVTCGQVRAASVLVNTVSGVNMNQLFNSLVLRDGLHVISGRVVIRGDLTSHRDLKVAITASVDLENPLRVDRTDVQVITGQHRVESVRSQSVSVEGRVNSVRVPEDVFLRRAGYSYTVPSAVFTQVLASSSVTVNTALDTITVTDGQLSVLRLVGDQVVTANKIFNSVYLLQGDPPAGYPPTGVRRRRHESSEGELPCGFRGSRGLTEAEARREALLWGVRSVATAQDLLSILAAIQPGIMTLPQHSVQFYARLAQDAPCAFSHVDDNFMLLLDSLEATWKNGLGRANLWLSQANITVLEGNVQKLKEDTETQLVNLRLSWHDVFMSFIKTRRLKRLRQVDILTLKLLIYVFENSLRESHQVDYRYTNCRLVCPELEPEKGVPDLRSGTCSPGVALLYNALRRISLYPSIIRKMKFLSDRRGKALQTMAVEQDLGRLLDMIRARGYLRQGLQVAVLCGVSLGSLQDRRRILELLVTSSRELGVGATFFPGRSTADPSSRRSSPADSSSRRRRREAPPSGGSSVLSSTDDPHPIEHTSLLGDAEVVDSTSIGDGPSTGPPAGEGSWSNYGPSANDGSWASDDLPSSEILWPSDDLWYMDYDDWVTDHPLYVEDIVPTDGAWYVDVTRVTEAPLYIEDLMPTDGAWYTDGTQASEAPLYIEDLMPIDGAWYMDSTQLSEPPLYIEDLMPTDGAWYIDDTQVTEAPLYFEDLFSTDVPWYFEGTWATEEPLFIEDLFSADEPWYMNVTWKTDVPLYIEHILPTQGYWYVNGTWNTEVPSFIMDILPTNSSWYINGSWDANVPRARDASPTTNVPLATDVKSSATDSSSATAPASATFSASATEASSTTGASSTTNAPMDNRVSIDSSPTKDDAGSTTPTSYGAPSAGEAIAQTSTSTFVDLPSTADNELASDSFPSTVTSPSKSTTDEDDLAAIPPTTDLDNQEGYPSTTDKSLITDINSIMNVGASLITDVPTTSWVTNLPTTRDAPFSTDPPSTKNAAYDTSAPDGAPGTDAPSITEAYPTTDAYPNTEAYPNTDAHPTTELIVDGYGISDAYPTNAFLSTSDVHRRSGIHPTTDDSPATDARPTTADPSTSATPWITDGPLNTDDPSTSATPWITEALPITDDLTTSTGAPSSTDNSSTNATSTTYAPSSTDTTPNTDAHLGTDNFSSTEFLSITDTPMISTDAPTTLDGLPSTDIPSTLGSPPKMDGPSSTDVLSTETLSTTGSPANTDEPSSTDVPSTTDHSSSAIVSTTPEGLFTDDGPFKLGRSHFPPHLSAGNVLIELLELRNRAKTTTTGACVDCVVTDVDTPSTAPGFSTGSSTSFPFHVETGEPSSTDSAAPSPTTSVGGWITESASVFPVTENVSTTTNSSSSGDSSESVRAHSHTLQPQGNSSASTISFEYCHEIPLRYYQEYDHMKKAVSRLRIIQQYLRTIAATQPWAVEGASTFQRDEKLDSDLLVVIGYVTETVEKLLNNTLDYFDSINTKNLEKEAQLFDAAMDFAKLCQYPFSNLVRPKLENLEALVLESMKVIADILACFEPFEIQYTSTDIGTTPMPPPSTDSPLRPDGGGTSLQAGRFLSLLEENKHLISRMAESLNFLKEVMALNPWGQPIDAPPPLAINTTFILTTAEDVREALSSIMADETNHTSSYNNQELSSLLLQHQTAMKMAQMLLPDGLPPDVEEAIRRIYDAIEPRMAIDAEESITRRLRQLTNANKALEQLISFLSEGGTEIPPLGKTAPTTDRRTTEKPFIIWRKSGPGSQVRGQVVGYRLRDLAQLAAQHLPVDLTPSEYIAANLASVRNMAFEDVLNVATVNGVDVRRVEDHGLSLSATTFDSSVAFIRHVTVVGDVRAARINGVSDAAYVTLAGQHVLLSSIVFQNTVSVTRRVAVVSTVNKVDLQAFSRSVALTNAASQVFSSSVAFVSVAAQSVECEVGQVAGVLVSDWVLLNQTAVITGKKTFLEVEVREGEVQAGRVTADFIKGVSVNRLFTDSLRKNPGVPQVVSGNMQIDTLVVEEDLRTWGLTTLPSDGEVLDLQRLASRVVDKTEGTSTIDGSLAFVGNTFFAYLLFYESFDAVTVADYNNGWLLATTEQAIAGHLSVVNMTSNDVITAPGVRIQGVDVAHLQNFAVMTDEPVVVTSSVRFGEVESKTDVYVAGLVQGWDLSEEGVLQNSSSSVVFTSSKTFLSSVFVTRNLHAVEVVSNVDLGSLCAQLTVDSLTVYGTVKFKNTVDADTVHVGGRQITGEAVDNYWMTDRDATLRARVRMRRMNALNIHTQRVNGRDIAKLWARMVPRFCNGSQTLTGTLHLLRDLTTDALITQAITATTMNGENTIDVGDILTTDGAQVVTGHLALNSILVVENVVTSVGTLNGVRVTEYCRRRSPCVIFAHKTFREDLVVRGDVDVQDNRTVQGVDVSAAFTHWISRYSCGQIPGLTVFSDSLALSRIRVHGLVNRVKVTSRHLLTRTGQQTLTAAFVITSPRDFAVLSPSISARDGLFNNLDLTELVRRAVSGEESERVQVSGRVGSWSGP
ncbi:uncharacterized protein [Panulirus ornatus]|uniref:uncharacterized protein isoform X2 n=1 Tax=Panulirus ornatus TaxID=150431 RepID=UPI003A8455A0